MLSLVASLEKNLWECGLEILKAIPSHFIFVKTLEWDRDDVGVNSADRHNIPSPVEAYLWCNTSNGEDFVQISYL